MNKRLVAYILALSLLITLCGCRGYRETDNCYIVTAIGFDGGEKTKISVEVVSSGGESGASCVSEIVSAEGESPEDAMFSLNSQISKILLFEHCTAVIIGENVGEKQFDGIMRFVKELKELNLSVGLFSCQNAGVLLKNSDATVSRGFDIAGNIKETRKDTGLDYGNRFFEVFARFEGVTLYGLHCL